MMHSRELIDLAALLATHAKTIVSDADSFPTCQIEQYWLLSRCRHNRWSTSLKFYSANSQDPANKVTFKPRHAAGPLLEEILTSEMLTRLWASVVCAHDRLHGTHDMEPIVRSVFFGHLESRKRALNLMVNGRGISVQDVATLNRLRRRTERWTDLLLGQLVDQIDISDFAFDRQRAHDFAADTDFEYREGKGQLTWQLVLASLHTAFQNGLATTSPNTDLNQRIAQSIFSCLPRHLFASSGLSKSLLLIRMNRTADETQGMIQEFLSADEPRAGYFEGAHSTL